MPELHEEGQIRRHSQRQNQGQTQDQNQSACPASDNRPHPDLQKLYPTPNELKLPFIRINLSEPEESELVDCLRFDESAPLEEFYGELSILFGRALKHNVTQDITCKWKENIRNKSVGPTS